MAKIVDISVAEGIKKVLADVTEVDQGPITIDTFQLFSAFPQHLRHALIIGTTPSAQTKTDLPFIENLSVNRGRMAKVFANREDILTSGNQRFSSKFK